MLINNLDRNRKNSPQILSEAKYRELAREYQTIAGIAKKYLIHESQVRTHVAENFPSLATKFAENQKRKFKYLAKSKAELKEAKEAAMKLEPLKPEPIHNGLKLAINYKKCITMYRYAIVCNFCSLVIAHTHSEKGIEEGLQFCPRCMGLTTIEDVQLDVYRKLILLKVNHLTSNEVKERE